MTTKDYAAIMAAIRADASTVVTHKAKWTFQKWEELHKDGCLTLWRVTIPGAAMFAAQQTAGKMTPERRINSSASKKGLQAVNIAKDCDDNGKGYAVYMVITTPSETAA